MGNEKELDKYHRFTIAVVTGIDYSSEGGRIANINYYFKNQSHNTCFDLNPEEYSKYKIGTKVFIKFSPKNPKNIEILTNISVPKKLESTIYGWKEIPKVSSIKK